MDPRPPQIAVSHLQLRRYLRQIEVQQIHEQPQRSGEFPRLIADRPLRPNRDPIPVPQCLKGELPHPRIEKQRAPLFLPPHRIPQQRPHGPRRQQRLLPAPPRRRRQLTHHSIPRRLRPPARDHHLPPILRRDHYRIRRQLVPRAKMLQHRQQRGQHLLPGHHKPRWRLHPVPRRHHRVRPHTTGKRREQRPRGRHYCPRSILHPNSVALRPSSASIA